MSPHRQRRLPAAFTLVEMTLAIFLSMGVASAVIVMLQQQVSFTRIFGTYQFLREEAPQINTLLTTLLGKADSYRIYGSLGNAMSSSGALQSDGRALRLRFRNPDGSAAAGIVSFETVDGVQQLNFYYRNAGETAWPTAPSWTISSRPALVDFSNDTGILLVAITGPNGEQITYAGHPQ
jgi:hypothetical protein